MSIVVRYNLVGMTAEKYDRGVQRVQDELGESGALAALDYHICFGPDGNLLVSEVWDSREQFEAFRELLLPVLAASGIDPGRIDVYDVHAVQKRESATA